MNHPIWSSYINYERLTARVSALTHDHACIVAKRWMSHLLFSTFIFIFGADASSDGIALLPGPTGTFIETQIEALNFKKARDSVTKGAAQFEGLINTIEEHIARNPNGARNYYSAAKVNATYKDTPTRTYFLYRPSGETDYSYNPRSFEWNDLVSYPQGVVFNVAKADTRMCPEHRPSQSIADKIPSFFSNPFPDLMMERNNTDRAQILLGLVENNWFHHSNLSVAGSIKYFQDLGLNLITNLKASAVELRRVLVQAGIQNTLGQTSMDLESQITNYYDEKMRLYKQFEDQITKVEQGLELIESLKRHNAAGFEMVREIRSYLEKTDVQLSGVIAQIKMSRGGTRDAFDKVVDEGVVSALMDLRAVRAKFGNTVSISRLFETKDSSIESLTNPITYFLIKSAASQIQSLTLDNTLLIQLESSQTSLKTFLSAQKAAYLVWPSHPVGPFLEDYAEYSAWYCAPHIFKDKNPETGKPFVMLKYYNAYGDLRSGENDGLHHTNSSSDPQPD